MQFYRVMMNHYKLHAGLKRIAANRRKLAAASTIFTAYRGRPEYGIISMYHTKPATDDPRQSVLPGLLRL